MFGSVGVSYAGLVEVNRVDRVERVEVGELNHEIHEIHGIHRSSGIMAVVFYVGKEYNTSILIVI